MPPLRTDSYDVLVIGGGIYGAWTAYDAALRGLRTLLIERDDWASGTSSASSKLIHGGLRYLEHGDVGLVAKALRERSRLLRLGPHRVRGLRFLLPQGRDWRRPRLGLLAGLWLYDRLAGSRAGLPGHRAWSRDELLAYAPFLAGDELRSGWSYPDAGEDDARMVFELVSGARAAGAECRAHCAATTLRRAAGQVIGAELFDARSGQTLAITAGITIATAGAWATSIAGLAPLPARFTKGVHLVMPALPVRDAFLLTHPRDGRVFFLIPFHGATLLGTTDTDHADPRRITVEESDIDYLLAGATARCPGLGWTRAQIRGQFAGVRVLQRAGGNASSVTREWECLAPEPGLLVSLGGKYTSARVEAVELVDRACRALGRRVRPSPTAHRPFPWAPHESWPTFVAKAVTAGGRLGLDGDCARTAAQRHGARLPQLLALLAKQPELAQRWHPEAPLCRGELVLAARDEDVHHLADVLRRRTPLALLAHAQAAHLADAAALVGGVLGWDAARQQSEILAVT